MRALLLVPLAALSATVLTAATPRIHAEFTGPELAPYAKAGVAVCEEWFPKIAAILYGPGHSSPYSEIRIVFDQDKFAGTTNANVIHLSPKWIQQRHELDYRAVVIHELTHTVQDYVLRLRCNGLRTIPCFFQIKFANHGPDWLGEGIADYITYTHFTGTNQPRLRLDRTGKLFGYTAQIPYLYGLQQSGILPNAAFPPRKVHAGKGYQHGYTVASAFLLWLEVRKDKEIVRKLNAALHRHSYRPDLFVQYAGAPLDRLWAEFLRESTAGAARHSDLFSPAPQPLTPAAQRALALRVLRSNQEEGRGRPPLARPQQFLSLASDRCPMRWY